MRDKGKITRLRMPICKVTKNLTSKMTGLTCVYKNIGLFIICLFFSFSANNIESSATLPQVINVLLQPKNELAFCRVQKLAQNPYLLIDLQSAHTIKYLISYLENKWKDRKVQFVCLFISYLKIIYLN